MKIKSVVEPQTEYSSAICFLQAAIGLVDVLDVSPGEDDADGKCVMVHWKYRVRSCLSASHQICETSHS